MKRIVSLLLVFVMLFSLIPAAIADDAADSDFEISGNKLVRYNGNSSSVTVPAEVEVIGSGAFMNNRKITSVRFAGKVTTIQAQAFAGCSKLARVSFADRSALESIGSYAFAGCLPMDPSWADSVKSVAGNAFDGCNIKATYGSTATPAPTAAPTPEPTAEPTAVPTAEPTAVPTAEPTAKPTAVPTAEPTAVPTAEPTAEPTAVPTVEPTVIPTEEPTAEATAVPTVEPTAVPTEEHVVEATAVPTAEPTAVPTEEPVSEPTAAPTAKPTAVPTAEPTAEPTTVPTEDTAITLSPNKDENLVENKDVSVSSREAQIEILTQPQDYVGDIGDIAVFSFEATGTGLTYQWQWYYAAEDIWKNSTSTGSTSTTMKVELLERRVGQLYRCAITDASGNVLYTETAQLRLAGSNEFTITSQPQDYTGNVGDLAKFTVAATGEDLTYQWQWYYVDGAIWKDSGSTGSKTNTLSIELQERRVGQEYRCKITDGNGEVLYSESAKLLLVGSTEFAITSQPQDYTGNVGDLAKFTVAVTGEDLTYQWQWYYVDGAIWKDSGSTGSTTNTLSIELQERRVGQEYRCKITDGNGEVLYSESAKLLLVGSTEFAITAQPQNFIGNVGDLAKFTVAATGEDLTYQWQWYYVDGAEWKDSGSAGSKTNTLSIELQERRVGQEYRCKITDGNGEVLFSESAKLLLVGSTEFAITSQPQDFIGNVGDLAKFTVAATGEDLTYQWQWYYVDGAIWKDSGSTGSTTNTLSIELQERRVGQEYRCKITDGNGEVLFSESAKLLLNGSNELAITSQPQNFDGTVGETAIFTVVASGDGIVYQWEWYDSTTSTWKQSGMTGSKTASLVVPITEARIGQSYRCLLTDAEGNQMYTDTAKIVSGGTIAFEITAQPEDFYGDVGDIAEFAVAANGYGLTYKWQWQRSGDTVWYNSTRNGATTEKISIDITEARIGQVYRCMVTDSDGNVLYSDPAQIYKNDPYVTVDDVKYLIEDGIAIVVEFVGSSSSLTIPSTIEGATVTRIGEGAFEGNTTLTSIDLPDSIQTIGARAFANCTNLSEVK